MAKFCGKCGARLDENTGKCPNCDKETTDNISNYNDNVDVNIQSSINQDAKKDAGKKTEKRKNKFKKIWISIGIILTLIIAAGSICFMVYIDKLDIPYVKDVFVSLGLKDEESTISPIDDENKETEDSNNTDTPTITDEDVDLSQNYEVPKFDAEKYFKENTTLKSSFDVVSSQYISTESEAYDNFVERGFINCQVTYEYTIDGTYSGTNEISRYSSSQHPMYQTYYTAANGDIWMVLEINGSYFATPISYNFADETRIPVMISETDTITSYDSTTNKFYVNIPDESQTVIKTVERIDAETLEKMTSEELDK